MNVDVFGDQVALETRLPLGPQTMLLEIPPALPKKRERKKERKEKDSLPAVDHIWALRTLTLVFSSSADVCNT